MTTTIRLLLCDDSAEARELARLLLDGQGGIEVVGEAANGAEGVALARELRPDVVLMDVDMPVLDGVHATRRLRELLPSTRVVAHAGSDDPAVVMRMVAAGAAAYCVKGVSPWELERAVVGAGDPLARLARALARASGEAAKAELAASELSALTGTRATVFVGDAALVPAGGAQPTPAVEQLAQRACAARMPARDAGAVALPLIGAGDVLGALVAAPLADDGLLASVAELLAGALAQERRLARVRAEARLDPVTGLPGRRAFDEALEAGAARAAAGDGELAVVLLELDEHEGHGEDLLCRVGRVLARCVRADEEVFRTGGAGFAVLVGGGREAARRVGERIRSALRTDRRGQPLPTISAGVAATSDGAAAGDELLRQAAAALYAASWSGRDRVLVYGAGEREPAARSPAQRRRRVLLVDDDPSLRALVRTTLEPLQVDVDEAADAVAAAASIAAGPPDAVVLDVRMPGLDGLSFCRRLKLAPGTSGIAILLLTGSDDAAGEVAARAAGADAYLRKPFSPLALLGLVERLLGVRSTLPFRAAGEQHEHDQTLVYAQDLRRLLEIERGQRALLQDAYRETIGALTAVLESKDTATGAHSQRVQRYAVELAGAVDPRLLGDPSLEYGFLLHDVGKVGIPDRILQKPGPLTAQERRLMETHAVLGEQLLGKVALLRGEGLRVVRSHHERWDGRGYPDGLERDGIPLGARIFAVADTLDAITNERPYRAAASWEAAVEEIVALAGRQFDPDVVEVFRAREEALRELAAVA